LQRYTTGINTDGGDDDLDDSLGGINGTNGYGVGGGGGGGEFGGGDDDDDDDEQRRRGGAVHVDPELESAYAEHVDFARRHSQDEAGVVHDALGSPFPPPPPLFSPPPPQQQQQHQQHQHQQHQYHHHHHQPPQGMVSTLEPEI
jgi:hypothetical protein